MKNTRIRLLLPGLVLFGASAVHAQTKVFKEVAEGISSQFEVIIQDDKLVGYLGFTQLEQASADSFNYRISIMDENLNDIGTVNFRERKLNLAGVSFEQDVLCLAYLKTNFQDIPYRNKKQFKEVLADAKSSLFTQFISLDGKVKATNEVGLVITPKAPEVYDNKVITGSLKHGIQLKNIPNVGFACFVGDEQKNMLFAYDASGKQLWKRDITDKGNEFGLQTSKNDVNLLEKQNYPNNPECGFMLASFRAQNGSPYPKVAPKDKKGNELKIVNMGNDPVTGDLVLSGMIIDPRKCNHWGMAQGLRHGIYCGVFSIDIKGHTRSQIQTNYAYWNDNSNAEFSKKGYLREAHAYDNVHTCFRDYRGNTWFAATGIHSHFRVGGMIAGAALFEFIFIPTVMELGAGFYRYKAKDVELLKLDPQGHLTYVNSIPTASASTHGLAASSFTGYEAASCFYYMLTNPETKTDYLVVTDPKNVSIYNVEQNKIARTIPNKEHKNSFKVLPAKEGYYMVSEYNQKEKTTRLSIEAL